MRFKTITKPFKKPFAEHRRSEAAFTLAEVLAALVFMAIVIPVAVQGVRVASLAGEVAHRKTLAIHVAEEKLNETILMAKGVLAVQTGTSQQGPYLFTWTVRNELWKQDAMREVTSEVTFRVQEQDFSVQLTTLVIP